jgi:hypothetical protein
LQLKVSDEHGEGAAESLVKELSLKYGKPVVRFFCDDLKVCEGTWRSNGQSIKLMMIGWRTVLISYVSANRSKDI